MVKVGHGAASKRRKDELRCDGCRKLIALWENGGLVIRCARCKADIRIDVDELKKTPGMVWRHP